MEAEIFGSVDGELKETPAEITPDSEHIEEIEKNEQSSLFSFKFLLFVFSILIAVYFATY